jgi:hypothetical protein
MRGGSIFRGAWRIQALCSGCHPLCVGVPFTLVAPTATLVYPPLYRARRGQFCDNRGGPENCRCRIRSSTPVMHWGFVGRCVIRPILFPRLDALVDRVGTSNRPFPWLHLSPCLFFYILFTIGEMHVYPTGIT